MEPLDLTSNDLEFTRKSLESRGTDHLPIVGYRQLLNPVDESECASLKDDREWRELEDGVLEIERSGLSSWATSMTALMPCSYIRGSTIESV